MNIVKSAIVEVMSGVAFDGNVAQDGGNTNQGGAIALKESASLRVQGNVIFVNNSAIGKNPNGGAVWISVATDTKLSGATFENNIVRVRAEYGYGGALHVESSKLALASCRFDSNVALLDDVAAAISATAGGISVWQDAELTVSDTSFSANQAGGIGQNEAKGSGGAEARLKVRAAHILSAGKTVARRCKLTSTAHIDLPYKAPWWIVGTGAGRITLLNSTFEGSTAGPAEGMLSLANDVTALLRGCAGTDVLIDPKVAKGKLGIVDSIFAPALDAALDYVAPPKCGTEVAGQPMCDPRAACKLRPSGGVECQCIGEGIEPPAGVRDDGSLCVTIPVLSCPVGSFVGLKGREKQCESCAPGFYSKGGTVTACTACSPGMHASCSDLPLRATRAKAFGCASALASPFCSKRRGNTGASVSACCVFECARTSCKSADCTCHVDTARLPLAGDFQSKNGSATCISCDNLGNYYQEKSGSTTCEKCPV